VPYLLDSDFVIDYLEEMPGATRLYPELSREGIAVSVVTFMEAYEGTLVAEDPAAALVKLNDLLLAALPIEFDRDIAAVCGGLRVRLRSEGKRVNPRAHDLQIAATAIFHGLTLVTRNVADYADVGVPIRQYTQQ
jgi:predicted nucleic acid-binding protein